MSQIIDRRPNSKHKSAVNRQRFLRRFKQQIKKAVTEAANRRSITDMERGEKITLPGKDIRDYHFMHGNGGHWEVVNSGNKEFVVGDHIKRAGSDAAGTGSQASDSGEGLDEFAFDLSREEFLELFFDDLALPNLVKKQLVVMPTMKSLRAGYTMQGTPANLSVIRSLRMAHGRRIALASAYKDKLNKAEEELKNILKTLPIDNLRVIELRQLIERIKQSREKIPFIDPFDLRYHNRVQRPLPSTQAVMFCIMDVSGSMDETKKEMAKRFFIMLYLFLTRNYSKIELVFIRHHTTAKQVDEQEFFYSRETGGTVVSSALELLRNIIREHYPASEWNIYAAQASDGDNWSADSPQCQELLAKYLMPVVQYYAYIEIMPRYHQSLWEAYLPVKELFPNFAMQTIYELADIYPALRELFKKEQV